MPTITKAVSSTRKTPLEDNTPIADYCLDENEVKPVVVPHQIPQNQAGGWPCSVDMEVKIIQKKIVKVQMILVKLRINLAAVIVKNQMKKKLI